MPFIAQKMARLSAPGSPTEAWIRGHRGLSLSQWKLGSLLYGKFSSNFIVLHLSKI